MDYKEKYKEALERARKSQENSNGMILKKWLWNIFPELKESEDEKIRKWIIDDIRFNMSNEPLNNSEYKKKAEKAIAWLEKQGEHKSYGQRKECIDCQFNYAGECKGFCQLKKDEQNPVDKVEPKFKVGNWYQCTKDFFGKGVTFDKNTAYYCAKEGCLQNEYRCHIAIVKGLYDNFKLWDISDAKVGDVLQLGKVTAIFQEYIGNGNCKCYCSVCDGEFEVPSQDGADNSYGCHNATPATKEQRDALIKAMTDAGYTFDFEKKELKEIEFKPDDLIEESYQQQADNLIDIITENPAEWSEEDEKIYQSIMDDTVQENQLDEKQIDWLRNIKYRNFARPQKQWKPSEEQMKALADALSLAKNCGEESAFDLGTLYEQLKKL